MIIHFYDDDDLRRSQPLCDIGGVRGCLWGHGWQVGDNLDSGFYDGCGGDGGDGELELNSDTGELEMMMI